MNDQPQNDYIYCNVEHVTRSGRTVSSHNYKYLDTKGTTDQQHAQFIKKMSKIKYKNKPMKKLKKQKKRLIVKLKDTYRSLIGIMMSQMCRLVLWEGSKDSKTK